MLKGTITISIPVEIEGLDPRIKLGHLEDIFQAYLESWSEGRYPFNVELLRDGFNRCTQSAVSTAVQERAIKDHPNEYDVTYNAAGIPNGKTARWVDIAAKAFRNVFIDLRTDRTKVTVR